jgi:hypothetical protein
MTRPPSFLVIVPLIGSIAIHSAAGQPAEPLAAGPEKILASGTVTHPRAASGEGTCLVVWQDGSPGIEATADIKAIRLRAATFEPVDKEPIHVCMAPDAQESPVVAYADGVFLVVWQDLRNGKDLDVRGVLVDAQTGQLRGSEIDIAVRPGNQARPAIASDGKMFLVVWQEAPASTDAYGIKGIRIAANGKVLDSTPQEYASRGTSPAVSVSQGRLLVAWTLRDRNRATTAAALVDARTGTLLKTLGTINTCCGDNPAAVDDAHGSFVVVSARAAAPDPWGWGGPGAVVLSRVLADGTTPESKIDYAYRLSNLCSRSVPNVVDAATWKNSKTWDAGAPGGFPGTGDGLWPTGSPSVVRDGRGRYLFAWVKGTLGSDRLTVSNTDIWLQSIDAKSLAVVHPPRRAAADPGANETKPVLVAGPQGEILLLYERLKAGEPRRIAVRRIQIAP